MSRVASWAGPERAVTGPAPETAAERPVVREPGRPLDPQVRARMERRFRHDFSGVRVHDGRWAQQSAVAEGARAYTAGRDLVFGAGRYSPQTGEGERLLAHELAHVVQQCPPGRRTRSMAGPEAAEHDARRAAGEVAGGRTPAVRAATTAGAVHRDDLTDEERRRLGAEQCRSGRCHLPTRPEPVTFGEPVKSAGSAALTRAQRDALVQWITDDPAARRADPLTPTDPQGGREPRVMEPPKDRKAPPGIAALGARPHQVQVVELLVPETKFSSPFGSWGANRMFSQAHEIARYPAVVNEPDPTAGYNFDTYLWGPQGRIPAQSLGGTRYRVFMGTKECPGCHLGQGLVVDLQGQPFPLAMAETLMAGVTLSQTARLAASLGRPRGMPVRQPAPRTPDDEYADFVKMTREQGGGVPRAGEPIRMQSHGGASEARRALGVTGENESMHGLPRSVGKHLPGYDPDAALTTLGRKAMHTEMDQPWKDAFQAMRRQGRTTASAEEVYGAVARSIDRSSQLSRGVKDTLKARLRDEMFIEYGLQPGQQMTLPYPNIKPRP